MALRQQIRSTVRYHMASKSRDVSTEDSIPASERRQERRVSARVDVRFAEAAQAARALRAYSLNFSLGGLCLRTQRPYAIGSVLHLTLMVESTEFQLEGVVAWQRDGTIGVRFVDVTDADRKRIQGLLRDYAW